MAPGDTAIEPKDGKLTLKQTPIKWYDLSSTLEALIEFTKFLQLPSTSTPLTEFPTQHLPLIARLVMESEKTITVLTKQVKKSIIQRCGVQDDKEATDDPRLPIAVLSAAIAEVATRVNYGVQDTPAALAVFRWELKNPEAMLPSPAGDPACNATVAKERRQEREAARDTFKTMYATLSDDQKKSVLEKQKKKEKNAISEPDRPQAESSKPKAEQAGESSKPSGVENVESNDKSTPKKETIANAPKQELSKTKTKQVQMMNAFFKPSKKTKPATPMKGEASSSETDFQRAFKPFLVRKDILLAPVNLFIARARQTGKGKGKEKAEVIVLDDDGDVQMSTFNTPLSSPSRNHLGEQDDAGMDGDASTLNTKGLLNRFLSSVPASRRMRSRAVARSNADTSTPNRTPSVRTIVTRLGEAEIVGDARAVGDLQRLLRNRRRIAIKVLQFFDNVRPAYYGTWTKTSQFVRPCAPFNKDHAAFDYSYDSGEEWEDEPEDAEEVVSGDEEEDESGVGEEEDEFDDWLVGDDDEDCATPNNTGRSISPQPTGGGAKRKPEAEKEKEQETKKRRVVAPLVPYSAGPYWEDRIGDCTVEHFKAFRIQLLNVDTPFPIDPFTYISEPELVPVVEAQLRPEAPKAVVPVILSSLPTQDGFVVPALPPHLHPSSQVNLPAPPTAVGSTNASTAKPKQANTNKKPFPQKHLPRLLREVEGSTLTKLHLTEQLGQIFKGHKEVKKYAIEKVLGEVASKVGGKWKVNEAIMARVGVA
ncbi:hypothetical protein FRB93_002457 [Tulasnella sp. JGI-2019a]|nr:hypothetical protein FRB93_002457 [Tulasnella sp. JGI-2019a]